MTFLFDEWLVDVALDRRGQVRGDTTGAYSASTRAFARAPCLLRDCGPTGRRKDDLNQHDHCRRLGPAPCRRGMVGQCRGTQRRRLFSYLRQGVASLVWDNIARGSNISCPHIEAALTASEISDRVLGVSCVETVPASTIQVFTGNSIAPRGDMASRSFIVSLECGSAGP